MTNYDILDYGSLSSSTCVLDDSYLPPEAVAGSPSLEGPGHGALRNKVTDIPLRGDNPHQVIMHRGNQDRRRQVIGALFGAGGDACNRWAEQMHACGRAPMLVTSMATGDIAIARARCKCRACPTCANVLAGKMRKRTSQIIQTMDDIRFLTLTIKSYKKLDDGIAHLIASLKRLRKCKAWRKHVAGGLWVLESTYSNGAWHPHLHLLIDGTFWAQSQISNEWLKASGSPICDIRRVASRKAAANYLAKYCSKGTVSKNVPADKMPEWLQAMKGKRTLATFGDAHARNGEVAKADKADIKAANWQQTASIVAMVECVGLGYTSAMRAMARVKKHMATHYKCPIKKQQRGVRVHKFVIACMRKTHAREKMAYDDAIKYYVQGMKTESLYDGGKPDIPRKAAIRHRRIIDGGEWHRG